MLVVYTRGFYIPHPGGQKLDLSIGIIEKFAYHDFNLTIAVQDLWTPFVSKEVS